MHEDSTEIKEKYEKQIPFIFVYYRSQHHWKSTHSDDGAHLPIPLLATPLAT